MILAPPKNWIDIYGRHETMQTLSRTDLHECDMADGHIRHKYLHNIEMLSPNGHG